MNLLFHILTSDPEHEASAIRTLNTAELMAKLGHNVYVVSNIPDYDEGKKRKKWFFETKRIFINNGVKYYQTFCVPFFYSSSTLRRLFTHYSFLLSSKFVRIEKKAKIDYVITTTPPLIPCKAAVKIAKRYKAKLVFDVHDIWPQVCIEMGLFKENGFKDKSFTRIANYLYKNCDFAITVSKTKVTNLDQIMKPFNKKAYFIPNATDKHFIEQTIDLDFLNKYHFDRYFSVVHVGKVGNAQDLDSLLDIAKLYLDKIDVRFFLLGFGVKLQYILDRIQKEGITNVIYCGSCNRQQCYTALSNSKLAYVSLVNENLKDSVPTKLFESLYCGCPVLLSACGESCDVVNESKFGLCSKPSDFKKLLENFNLFYQSYDKIFLNKQFCFDYINTHYERMSVTKQLEKLLLEHLND